MASDEKSIANTVYHGATVAALTIGYARLGKVVMGGPLPKLDLSPRDTGLVVMEVVLALATKNMLVKQGIIPDNILR